MMSSGNSGMSVSSSLGVGAGGGSGNYHTDINNTDMGGMGDHGGGMGMMGDKSSSFLASASPHSKHDDLKMMLESNKDGLKLEAMKRIITMIAKGRSGDAPRELFPHVVKNVVTKNAELKKLVYLYLTRYAEQEQDLALLSIATFQRSLKDPNPLIRASAIRVLSSIRVSMIAPIMLIAIRDCSNDMSPYVRKTAAHAIPKLFSLDPDLKNEIMDIIERLLNDKTSLVLGSAVAAFEEVCPDRLDLIHENYRKFCSLLVDVDEWGQVILINMLMRYARTQFIDPNKRSPHLDGPLLIDPDHRMLLRCAKPLLQSRNSAVVLAVIQLFLNLAPNSEISAILVKPLIRLLHSHREIQLVVLRNIATLTAIKLEDMPTSNDKMQVKSKRIVDHDGEGDDAINQEDNEDQENGEDSEERDDRFDVGTGKKSVKTLFEPYLKSFFIKSKDTTQVKKLKLEILTNLSNSSNISLILREFQAYIMNYQEEEEFMDATIQSIGHCASRIKEIAPVCLNGLISLLSNRNEAIVSQSIVVIRTQIINKDEGVISMIVKQMTKLMSKITTAQARATILWILAEFCSNNTRARNASPDVLRQLAKTFCAETNIVKLQALNLAAKLYINNEDNERLKLLVNYLFNLAKYDLNYDVRDRGRILRQLLNDVSLARRVLLAPKYVPNISKRVASESANNARFRVGTLSHFLGKKVNGYEELPDWPEEQPDPSVRAKPEPEEPITFKLVPKDVVAKKRGKKYKGKEGKENGFYGDEEESSEESESDEESSEGESGSGSEESSSSSGEEEDSDSESSSGEEEEESGEESEESSESGSDSDSEEEKDAKKKQVNIKQQQPAANAKSIIAPTTAKQTAISSNVAKKDSIEKRVQQEHPSKQGKQQSKPQQSKSQAKQKQEQKQVDFLLDLDDIPGIQSNAPVLLLPSNSQQSQQHIHSQQQTNSSNSPIPTVPFRILETAEIIPTTTYELLKVAKRFSMIYRFPRFREGNETLVELIVTSESDDTLKIRGASKVVEFKGLVTDGQNEMTFKLVDGEIKLITLGIDFNESPSQGVEITVNDALSGKIIAPTGEILTPVQFNSLETFKSEQAKLKGMNEVMEKINLVKSNDAIDDKAIVNLVLKVANVGTNRFIEDSDDSGKNHVLRFAGATLKVKSFLLVTIERVITSLDGEVDANNSHFKLIVNCEKMIIGSMIAKTIKDAMLKL